MHRLLPLLLLNIVFILTTMPANAQGEDKIWIFGDHARLDFTSGSPVLSTSNINTREGAASISDAGGNLLFYSNGQKVWASNFAVMPNGNGLLGNGSSGSSTQGVAIVPVISNPDQYYLFTLDPQEYTTSGIVGYLRYSVIDMSLNGGMGDVLPSQKNIILDSFMSEQMTVTSTNSCAGYWLVVRDYSTGNFKSFKIDAVGIHACVVSAGSGNANNACEPGEMKISPDGTRIGWGGHYSGLIELGTFNNATGVISNVISMSPANPQFYGFSFSPDGSKIYASHLPYLQQFDATLYPNAANILASGVILTTFNAAISYNGMRIGPDGKIYLSVIIGGTNNCISTIDNPNISGTGCNFSICSIPQPITADYEVALGSSIVINHNPPQVTINPTKDTFICTGSIVLTASPNGNYMWNTGATGQSITVQAPGTYWATSGSGCSLTVDTFKVTQNDIAPDHFLGNDTILCEGSNLLLNASAPGCTYQWQDGNINPVYEVTEAGIYFVMLTKNGCAKTDTIQVTEDNSYLYIDRTDTTVCLGISITLTAETSVADHQWSTGSTATSIEVTVPGTYRLSGTSPCNAFADSVVIGMIDCSCPLMVPNAFSPNGDGLNDVFTIQNNCELTGYGLYIYNRFGQQIFYSNNINNSWDGNYKGQKCDLGVYYYFLKYKNPANESIERKGDISLMR
jgi:gliding motility-associated-like protein